MRITQWGEYAVHFCIFLGQHQNKQGQAVSAADIAEKVKIDQLYAQQILQRLRKGDIIKSIRGANGGYCLARKPEEISLKDILIAAEGDTFAPICEGNRIDHPDCAEGSSCGLRGVWYSLREHIDSFLAAKSLKDLIGNESDLVTVSHINGRNRTEILDIELSELNSVAGLAAKL